MTMTLVRYRDAQMDRHILFWVDEKERTISPNFDTEEEAKNWVDAFENWRPSKDIA